MNPELFLMSNSEGLSIDMKSRKDEIRGGYSFVFPADVLNPSGSVLTLQDWTSQQN